MKQTVPFNDLSRYSAELQAKIASKASEVSVSGSFILGEDVSGFEKEIASYLGTKWAVGVGNGTDGLILSLTASGVGPGDTVMTMSNAGAYTTIAAKAVGAELIFVDVETDTLQMSLATLKWSFELSRNEGLSPKALVVTHLFGQLNPDIEAIATFASDNNLFLIEDCAQAIGARSGSKMAGTFGDLSTFSFYPTKNLGASGDGGLVAGNDIELLQKVSKLRQYGWSEKYSIDLAGGKNSRLDEIQAAILRIKLKEVDGWNQRRRDIFQKYISSSSSKVKFYSKADESFVGHLCAVTVEGISQVSLTKHFSSRGIATSIHFPVPDHSQQIELAHRSLVALPVTEWACANLITIPLFPELTDSEVESVCSALRDLET
jgi:dTDP-4-amino-4,6-dideoxygalactose transaminase